jgi:hypothetical protein
MGADMRGAISEEEVSDPVQRRNFLQNLLDIARAEARKSVDLEDHDALVITHAMGKDVVPHILTLLGDNEEEVTFTSVAKAYLQHASFSRQQVKKQVEFVVKEFGAFLNGTALREITQVTLHDYAQHLSDNGAAYNTIRGRIDKISLVFHHAVRKGIVSVNPCIGLRLWGYGKPRQRYKPLSDLQTGYAATASLVV